MEHNEISEEARTRLIKSILPIILQNGLKATTMDHVAASLSMSKRTLYEIFGSKNDMLKAVISFTQKETKKNIDRIFENADNMMEALVKTLRLQLDGIKSVSVEFFRDMDSYYKCLRDSYEEQVRHSHDDIMYVIKEGVKQEVFRDDINYEISVRMFRIQMESLKRMEEFFPPDVTLADVFDSITTGFLRSIASPKGMKILDEMRKTN